MPKQVKQRRVVAVSLDEWGVVRAQVSLPVEKDESDETAVARLRPIADAEFVRLQRAELSARRYDFHIIIDASGPAEFDDTVRVHRTEMSVK